MARSPLTICPTAWYPWVGQGSPSPGEEGEASGTACCQWGLLTRASELACCCGQDSCAIGERKNRPEPSSVAKLGVRTTGSALSSAGWEFVSGTVIILFLQCWGPNQFAFLVLPLRVLFWLCLELFPRVCNCI